MAAIPWPNGTGVAEGFMLPAEFGPKRLSFQNGVASTIGLRGFF